MPDRILESLQNTDVCSVGVLAAVFIFLGQRACQPRVHLFAWSVSSGVAVFLAWVGFDLWRHGIANYAALAGMLIRGAVLGGLLCGACSLIFPIVRWFWAVFIEAPMRWWPAWKRALSKRREIRHQKQQAERDREEWERRRPERDAEEQRRRETEACRAEAVRHQQESEAQAQVRRKEARSQCELLFNLHKPEIGNRFSRKMFLDYISRYMPDTESPEIVERRAAELHRIIEKHLERVGKDERPTTIEQLAKWYIDEKAAVERLDIDEQVKAEHLYLLELRYSELSQNLLENMRP